MKKTNQKQNANVQKLYRLRAKYREKMHREIDAYDRFEQAGKEISRFMELTPRGCGILRSNKEVSSGLQKIAQELQKDSVSSLVKMGRYLEQRAKNLGHYLDALHSQLEVVVQDIKNPSIVEAAVRAYQASLLVSQGGPVLEKKERQKELQASVQQLLMLTNQDNALLIKVMGAVFPILAFRHRSSSMIENVHSVLRPHLFVQKNRSPAFLNLFQFYWGCAATRTS